tara:strand:+ start:73 stop:2181 length:2109 start_codon:yes stop_codon:yes gene_type:complete
MRLLNYRFCTLGPILFAFLCSGTLALPVEPLTATKNQSTTTIEIVKTLAERHYRNQPLNDKLSGRYLDQYIDTLDPAKAYFFAADIEEFNKQRFNFDDDLRNGKLSASFAIFDRFRQHMNSRLEWLIDELLSEDAEFVFDGDGVIYIDRSDADAPKDKAQADELWRNRLTSSLLSLKLADKTIAEAKDTLLRRYKQQLKRLKQQDSADVFEVMINALTMLYDPHTSYLSPRTLENFNINMSLSLEGIGAVLQSEDDFTKVVKLVAKGPADKQGELKVSDKIVSVGQGVDGELVDVVGWRLDEVVKLIRGPKETVVRLEVIPAKAATSTTTEVIKINRGKVKLEDQAAQKAVFELTNGKEVYRLGVIDIPAFYMDFDAFQRRDPNFKSTTRDVLKLLAELKQEKVDGIVLDLRNNGGGSLHEATTLTDLFVDPGPVVQIRQTTQTISRHHISKARAQYRGPLVVLINRFSASASEIFAGAIQDYGRGIIIGDQSFGKGTVQSLAPLKEGRLKITESKFYRISGDSTQHRGVIPDVVFPTMVDKDDVGESSYDTALPWDQIHAVPHSQYFDIGQWVPALQKQHNLRAPQDPDYTFLIDQWALIEQARKRTTISLNEKVRLEQQQDIELQQLSIENKRRKSKGLSVYKTFADIDDGTEDGETPKSLADDTKINPDKDPLLTEAGYILVDFIDILKKYRAPKVAKF